MRIGGAVNNFHAGAEEVPDGMARPREYDMKAVLARAMEAFWRRGYAATAMSDIYAATGLKPGSIYGAFGDKDGLFRAAFEAYAEQFRATLPRGLHGFPAIEAWLRTQVDLAAEDPERRGCLIINTVLERDLHPPATQALAQGRLKEIRDFFLRELAHGIAEGSIPRGIAIDAQADALMGAVVSVMSLGRAGVDRRTIANVAEAALAPLRPPHS